MHPRYAASLAEFGTPYQLPRCGGWILNRRIAGNRRHDAMGCYPLFACLDWQQLHADLEDLSGGGGGDNDSLVSIALVTDPFGDYTTDCLRQSFKDVVIPFKEHFILDLTRHPDCFVSPHHRYYARKALRDVAVERCDDPPQFIDDWMMLYSALVEKHEIRGIPAFSRRSFIEQLKVPGMVIFRALCQQSTIGMTLWYVQGGDVYSHLSAYSDQGYKQRASYALFWTAIQYFAVEGLRRLNLGAGAGLAAGAGDGLTKFKGGWASGTQTAYFCGRIFDRDGYAEIVREKGMGSGVSYFPAYRAGEFG